MSVTFAKGFEAAGVVAGISSQTGKQDVALVVNNGPLNAAAGVFTSNRFCAGTRAVVPQAGFRRRAQGGHSQFRRRQRLHGRGRVPARRCAPRKPSR